MCLFAKCKLTLASNYLWYLTVYIICLLLVLCCELVQYKLRHLSTFATTSGTRDHGNTVCVYFG